MQAAALTRSILELDLPILDLDWAAGEAEAQVVIAPGVYLNCTNGERSPIIDVAHLAALNALPLEMLGERRPMVLAEHAVAKTEVTS